MADATGENGGMSFLRNFFGKKPKPLPASETEETQPPDDRTTQSILGDFADAVDFQAAKLRRPSMKPSGPGRLPVSAAAPTSGSDISAATTAFVIFSASTPLSKYLDPGAETVSPEIALAPSETGTPSTWATPAGGLRFDPPAPDSEPGSGLDESSVDEMADAAAEAVESSGETSSKELVTESLYEELDSIFGQPAKRPNP